MGPIAGTDYPRDYGELRAWFPDDARCLDYLDWLRWGNGFACPSCGVISPPLTKPVSGRELRCPECGARVSRTAGTIFQDTRTPLTVWFQAAWLMTTNKSGLNAKALQRQLGLGSYQTAWAMLHRFRSAMDLSGTDLLTGTVEVDETFYGGVTPGVSGRLHGNKAIIAVAVERLPVKGFGRARLRVINDLSAATMTTFLKATVAPGSLIASDGWRSYPVAVPAAGCSHAPSVQRGNAAAPHDLLPGVHRVASLFKRWALGTHQGSIGADHIQSYLNEFAFRFNRRNSRAPGMLFFRLMELAATADPLTYRSIVANPAPKATRPSPPNPSQRSQPRSLNRPTDATPWRR